MAQEFQPDHDNSPILTFVPGGCGVRLMRGLNPQLAPFVRGKTVHPTSPTSLGGEPLRLTSNNFASSLPPLRGITRWLSHGLGVDRSAVSFR